MGGHHGAVCAPSRAMLMSGKNLFHVYDNLNGITTMPMYFGRFGYETFGTGKWHNGANTFEASFKKGVFIGGMCDHYQIPCRRPGEDGKLTDTGHQTSVITTNYKIPMALIALIMFSRWSQENFFRYMRQAVSYTHLRAHET